MILEVWKLMKVPDMQKNEVTYQKNEGTWYAAIGKEVLSRRSLIISK